MELQLIRFHRTEHDTLGLFLVNGTFQAFTMEDTWHPAKIPSQTRIPEGRYRIAVTFSPKFGRKMPEVLNVPGYSGIRIHSGNTNADTAGCILLGLTARLDPTAGPNRIEDSRLAMGLIEPVLDDALARGEEVWLTIERRTEND